MTAAQAHATVETPEGVAILGPMRPGYDKILTPAALAFLADLHRSFDPTRNDLLVQRNGRQNAWDAGELPGFLEATAAIREDPDWKVGPIPAGLQDRRVEITGPVDRKMIINALNSGAKVFMTDFEDSNSPTWDNNLNGQLNIKEYAETGKLELHVEATGKTYAVGDDPAVLVTRVRGWHLDEAHITVDGSPMSASLFDFGLHFFHNHATLPKIGLGPWYYLPKMEHHMEGRLWNDVFVWAQDRLGVEQGTIKVTCLIETFPMVFQMEELIHQLRDHLAGLNAGRWDYIFSCIKTCRNHPDKVLPDRGQVTMTVPFMRAYTELLVQTCHKRGAFAMGGMSAFIPNRRDPEVTENALAQVRADKEREAADGCDGTWVAHPDLVPVAMEIFDAALGDHPNQVARQRNDVTVTEDQLQDFSTGGTVTRDGLRGNIDVGLQYLASWLGGSGAVAIHNLMEDAATAEISRSQVWQWVHNDVELDDGTTITADLVRDIMADVLAELKAAFPASPHWDLAAELFGEVALSDSYQDFLTLPAYQHLTKETLA